MTERQAIIELERLAKHWPKTLWLFAASGSLNVMKKSPDGDRAYISGGGPDDRFTLATINIPADGGDW